MKLPTRQQPVSELPGVTGTVRVDRRTANVLRRLHPGDIAVIDHLDLDRGTAEAMAERGAKAVVNATTFISGRYPNLGPELLAAAGVVLVEDVGIEVFSRLKDGATGRVHDGTLYVAGSPVATGHELTEAEVQGQMDAAREGLATQLQSFTHNTTEYLKREQELLLHGRGIPELRTKLRGRPVVVVVKGFDYRADLKGLRRFIREQKPVLLGVDAGADALLEAGHRPHVVLVGAAGFGQGASGQNEPVSDRALRSAAEVVLHTDATGRAVGAEHLSRLGIRAGQLSASGTSEDVAMLVADLGGASSIITVGTHATLDEFLDRQREGLASTFLTRLRVGPKLVDAKGVPQLYAGRVRVWHLTAVLLAGLLALAVAVSVTPVGADWLDQGWPRVQSWLTDLVDWIQGLFS